MGIFKWEYLKNFSHQCAYNASVEGVPLVFFKYNAIRAQKCRMVPLPDRQKTDDVSIDTVPSLDRQTDIRAELVKQYRAVHA